MADDAAIEATMDTDLRDLFASVAFRSQARDGPPPEDEVAGKENCARAFCGPSTRSGRTNSGRRAAGSGATPRTTSPTSR